MSSSVFFKFKSQKEPTRVEFDGTGISVFELKRDIILKSGLGDGTDFDLAIYTDDGGEEYDDDTTIIPRSTTVVARRLPPPKPGAGRAARYVSGKAPVNAKNASRREQVAKATAKATSNAISQMNSALTEEEKIAAMFAAQTEQWNAQQEEMSHQAPVFKPGSKRPANVPDHPPPTGYICYRCGEKGHWIQLCPTNDGPEFDNRPRVKRTTGIPRSFLKTVDKAAILAQAAEDDTKAPSGIMVNADGDFVIAEPDKVAWEKFQAKTKQGAAAKQVAALADKELQERGLECPIDNKLFIEPMKTPCCEKTYCNDCITNALIESDFVCPGCSTEGVLIDDLVPDEATEKKIAEYQAEKGGNAKTEEASKSPAAAGPATPSADEVKPETKAEENGDVKKSKSPLTPKSVASPPKEVAESTAAAGTTNDTQTSKKRPAEEPAENPRIPKGPKAMQKQLEAQDQQQMMQQMMNGMPGLPGMMPPFPMGMPNMAGMPGLPGFGMGMPNMNMPGFGMGMPNMSMPPMPGMNMGMMNPMMNPMMGMNGMNGMNGGFGGGRGGQMGGLMPNGPQQGWGGMNGQNGNMGGGGRGGNMGMNGGMMNGGGFNNGAAGSNFNQAGGGAEDDAYFRKPVNPHRHQNRQKRVRPSDFTELGN